MKIHDLIVIGAGPAGSTCASLCAEAGLSVLLLEAARFPRDKVCGDCLNPSVWPVLDRLALSARVRSLPSSSPANIRFSVAGHGDVTIPLPTPSTSPPTFLITPPIGSSGKSLHGELVVRRRDLDALLVDRAMELGVEFQDGSPVTSLIRSDGIWEVTTSLGETRMGRRIVAADGRNSAVARHLRMLPARLQHERIGLQTHIPHPAGYDGALEMRLYRNGYGGLADLGNGLANLCLVANAGAMRQLRGEAEAHYPISSAIAWRSITPIHRRNATHIARNGVFLCGDAARVVEPFTGEGIAYAFRSGELLADILASRDERCSESSEKDYRARHRALYGRGLAVNRLTRFLSEHPRLAHRAGPFLLRHPGLLGLLTSKVIRS